mmetsp:Transcript_77488/g.240021  ORF Transcript_77488/g.240021 Transcript_77488/m.240021 type:complete len:204 (+) Transcript_77488:3870-4481(+)
MEEREGPALAIGRIVEGLAEAGLAAVARSAAAPNAGLILDLQDPNGAHAPAVLAGQAILRVPDVGAAAAAGLLQAGVVVGGQRDIALLAVCNLVHSLGNKVGECHTRAIHDVVKRLAEACAVCGACDAAAPDARLTCYVHALERLESAAVRAGHARLHVTVRVAAFWCGLQALQVLSLRLLRNPERHQWPRLQGGLHVSTNER